jgi:hypothetical protein
MAFAPGRQHHLRTHQQTDHGLRRGMGRDTSGTCARAKISQVGAALRLIGRAPSRQRQPPRIVVTEIVRAVWW